MTSGSDIPEDRRWLLEPAAPGEVKFNIEFGPETEIAPEVREAVERLVEALHVDDVGGYVMPGAGAGAGSSLSDVICWIYAPPSCGTNSCTTRGSLMGRLAS
jgi:hypothetical protein